MSLKRLKIIKSRKVHANDKQKKDPPKIIQETEREFTLAAIGTVFSLLFF